MREELRDWLSDSAFNIAADVVRDIGATLFYGAIEIIPDIVGYAAIATGAFVILGSMIGVGMLKPLGFFAALSIVSISILAVV